MRKPDNYSRGKHTLARFIFSIRFICLATLAGLDMMLMLPVYLLVTMIQLSCSSDCSCTLQQREYEDACYEFVTASATRTTAEGYCYTLGGFLATPKTSGKSGFVLDWQNEEKGMLPKVYF